MQQVAAAVSLVAMGVMIAIQLDQDAQVLTTQTLSQRINDKSLTSVELIFVWGLVGVGLYQLARSRRRERSVAELDAHGD
jgi:hypothetical protein